MPAKNFLDDTPFDEQLFGGKLITARQGFLVGKDNFVSLYNMRYSTGGVGIETRGGMRRFNDTGTAVTAVAAIEKIWQHLYTFEQTKAQDVYAVSDTRKLFKADSIPEASAGGGSLASSLYDFSTGAAIPSFCNIDQHTICSSQKDLIGYSGATPYPASVLYGTDIGTDDDARDEDNKTFSIYTDEVTNADTSRSVTITLDIQANNEAFYVGTFQPIRGVTFDLGASVNNNAANMTAEYWNGSAWSAVDLDSTTDATFSAGATWAQDGAMTWTYIAEGTERPRKINGQTLFWYRFQTSATLDAVEILSITTLKDWRAVQDLTDGIDVFPSGFLWFDDGQDEYNDVLDRVLIDSKGSYITLSDSTADTDVGASDLFYIGFPQRVMGIKIFMVEGYGNTGNAATLTPAYWNGTAFSNYNADEYKDGTLNPSDSTYTLSQTGEIRLEDYQADNLPSTIPQAGIKLPMYWYKVAFSAKLYNDTNDEMRIWKVRGVPAPMRQSEIQNCQWVSNFKQRLWRFGPEGAPNLGEFSAFQNPFALSGNDTSSVWPRMVFGNRDEIICAVNFFNEILVFKRREVWMMEGDSPDTFGTLLIDDTLGCVAPETAKLVRTWITLPDGRRDFRYAVFFMSHDGVWACDGLRCWKVSEDIENYFNQKFSSTVIKTGYRSISTAFFDPLENEYHLFIWSGSTPTLLEFIFNTEYQKWNGPFVRSQGITCGESVIDSNDDRQSYGGAPDGRMYRLEYGSNDADDSGNAIAINNYAELGDGWTGLLSKFAHRGVFLFGKAQASGNVNIDFKGDGASSPVDLGNISMVRSGYATFIGRVNIGEQDSAGDEMENKFHSSRLLFSTNAVDVQQELFGFLMKKADVTEAATI